MAKYEKNSLEYQINEIVKYNPKIRKLIESNQALKGRLESTVMDTYNKYKGLINTGTLIDKLDRFTATIKTGLGFFGLPGKVLAAAMDLPELIAKGVYALYYSARTGDVGALPGWVVNEGLSSILPFGQLLDYRNIYKNRAHKMIRKKAAKQFLAYLKGYVAQQEKPDYNPRSLQPAFG